VNPARKDSATLPSSAAVWTGRNKSRANSCQGWEARRLPRHQCPPSRLLPRPTTFAIDNPGGAKELILIIDDEALIVTLAKRMLTDAGYRVVTSAEPFQALEVFKQLGEQVDLVILDFTLPIMDGSEVFAALRKIKPSVAVMLSSGFAEQDKVRAMLSQGLRGFLPKPYTQEKLLAQVRSTLDAIRIQSASERRAS